MPRRSARQRRKGLELSLTRQQNKRSDAVEAMAPSQMITDIDAEIAMLKRERARLDKLDLDKRSLENEAAFKRKKDRLTAQMATLSAVCEDLPGAKIDRLSDQVRSLRLEWRYAVRRALRSRSRAALLRKAQEAGKIYARRRERLAELLAERAAQDPDAIKKSKRQKRKLQRLGQQLQDVDRDLQKARGSRGKDLDRFGLLVARSEYLTQWHYRIGQRLLDTIAVAQALSGPVGYSGNAGDGDGRMHQGIEGDLGDDYHGRIGVPGVTGSESAEFKNPNKRMFKSFKPRQPKAQRSGGDGGMMAALEAAELRDKCWQIFENAAEQAGLREGGRIGFGRACRVFMLGDDDGNSVTAWEACTMFVRGKKTTTLKTLNIAIAAGLEAVSVHLGIDFSAWTGVDGN